MDHEAGGGAVGAEAEMGDEFAAGGVAAGDGEGAALGADGLAFDTDYRADAEAVGLGAAEPDLEAVLAGSVVAEGVEAAFVVEMDEIEVAVVVEVGGGGAEGDAYVLEAPGCGDGLEAFAAKVAVGEV